MTSRRAPAWLVAPLLALVAGAAVTAAPVRAAERCDGVWVVVDATALGAAETTRCAAGDPATGLDALRTAGHSYAFTPRQPGMVCTIDARPDPCNGAPPDAYWSYWHAEAGGGWTYATRGAGSRDPEPGTVEGWAFGAGEPPRRPPPAPAPAEPAEPAEPSEPSEPAAPAEDTAPPATSDEPAPTESATSPGPSPAPTPYPTADLGGATAPTPSPTEPTELASPTPLAGEVVPEEGGTPLGLFAGGALVVAVAGAGLLRARRHDHG